MDSDEPKLKPAQDSKRRILRGIYGPLSDNTTLRYRTGTKAKLELEELYNEPYIVQIIKSERLRWTGPPKKQDKRVIKLVYEEILDGKQPLGRPSMMKRKY